MLSKSGSEFCCIQGARTSSKSTAVSDPLLNRTEPSSKVWSGENLPPCLVLPASEEPSDELAACSKRATQAAYASGPAEQKSRESQATHLLAKHKCSTPSSLIKRPCLGLRCTFLARSGTSAVATLQSANTSTDALKQGTVVLSLGKI